MKIKMLVNVRPDWPFGKPGTILRAGMTYKAKQNKNGAVSGLCDNGEWLGVKPDEFEKVHELKTLPEYFEYVRTGEKNFEVRKNDRDFKVGDLLILQEWDGSKYTGRDQRRKIGYILENKDYCKEGYVILGFDVFYNMI